MRDQRPMLNLLLVWFLVLPVAVAPAPEKEGMCPAGQCSGDASGGGAELVSVVTPTRAKTHGWHPLLYECFKRQDYQPKELIVIDDAPEPSAFFADLADPSVRYIRVEKPVQLGEKRNLLSREARGTVIAHFDDDDWYGSTYLSTMVRELRRRRADAVKLSGWFLYSCKFNFFGYWDPAETAVFSEVTSQGIKDPLKYSLWLDPRDEIVQTFIWGPTKDNDVPLRDETRFGYGFTYVYTKELAGRVAYNASKTFGEDLQWIVAAQRAGATVAHFADRSGLTLHVQGHWNTAKIPTQYRIPGFLLPKVFDQTARNHTRCRIPAKPGAWAMSGKDGEGDDGGSKRQRGGGRKKGAQKKGAGGP